MADESKTDQVVVRRAKFRAIPGKNYRAQGFALSRSGALGDQALYLEFYDGAGKVLGLSGTYTGNAPYYVWSRVSVDAKAPAGAVAASLVIKTSAAAVSTVYWDGVSAMADDIINSNFEMAPSSTAAVPGWTSVGTTSLVTGGLGARSARMTDNSSTAISGMTSSRIPTWPSVAQDLTLVWRPIVGNVGTVVISWYNEAGVQVGRRGWPLP